MSRMTFNIPHPPPMRYASLDHVRREATRHARERLEIACETMFWIGRLARRRPRNDALSFKVVGDPPQDGSVGGTRQAAHKIPGMLLIGDREAWTYGRNDKERSWGWARFAVTEALDMSFNGADSAAEDCGLREAFRVGCEKAWKLAASRADSLVPVFAGFLEEADYAFLIGFLKKTDRARQLRTSLVKADQERAFNRELEALALEGYRLHGLTASEAARNANTRLAESGLLTD